MSATSSVRQEAVPSQPSEFLRDVVKQNRQGKPAGTYAVCSAHPAVLDAAISQSLADGAVLHVESTSSQVNQFGGYTGTNPAQFAAQMRRTAEKAGLPFERVLLGAERTAALCKIAEDSFASLPSGSPQPLYVIGTEVPIPGGEVAEGEPPAPTRIEDLKFSLNAFQTAFKALGLASAWERIIGMVVQPGVEFGDSSIFEYDRKKAASLVAVLPSTPELVFEAHSTDYQTPSGLLQLVQDHFAILKVGPWLTLAYREAIFALGLIEREMPEHKTDASHVREVLEAEMLRNPANWRPYYHGDEDQQKFARAFSLSDRCRYYWPQAPVQQEIERLMHNLGGPLPLALLSQYLPSEYDAIREGRLPNSAPAVVRHHIQRVLRVYAQACGVLAG